MRGLFNPDNPIMRALSKLYDIVYLSLVWLLFCIPIITIGASTTALYYTSVKVLRKERGYIFHEFWHAFRLNFGSATVIWIIEAVIGILFVGNMRFALAQQGRMGQIMPVVYMVMIIIFIMIAVYLFPVLSRFSIKFFQLIKTSFFMSIKHLPRTILMAFVVIVSILSVYLIFPLVFIMPAAGSMIFSYLMEPILRKYTPKAKLGESQDEWYLQ